MKNKEQESRLRDLQLPFELSRNEELNAKIEQSILNQY